MIHREFEEEYRKNLEEIRFPEILEGRMKCISCLKERQNTSTLLTEDENGKRHIVKTATGRRIRALKRENQIMGRLREAGVNAFAMPEMFIIEEDKAYYVREYVEGETLISVVKKYGCMPESVLLETGIRLCKLLEILHSQNPPVIHRDIKPENIVVRKDRTLTLIDFETAGLFLPGKAADSVHMASRPTAAPEQFGLGLPDCRTDVYGIGMTLLYLSCGSYEREELKNSELSAELKIIIRKTLSLNIDRRYSSVIKLRKKLECYRRKRHKTNGNRRDDQTGNDTNIRDDSIIEQLRVKIHN